MEPQEIREGYLVKKGTLLNTWKAVWAVLSEDGVEFFKKKTDRSPKGMIPLKGATLVSPCQDFGKRTLVFKLTTDKKQDHFFQASHVEERESWVKDIKRVLTCLQGGKRFARKSTRRSIRLAPTINLSELYALMKDQDDGVKELKLEQDNRIFNHCFTGATVVEWLISKEKARNRPEALMLATGLLNEGFLQPAGDLAKDGAESGDQTNFLDQTNGLYYFADSGFFCEGNSSDEDVLLKEEFRGNIVKQGCLLKQGHRRKNWKVRKFILRDDPAYIHYYDPTKGDDPLGSIHLRGSVVTAVEYVPDAKKYDIDGNLFEIITSDEVHYFFQAATAEERREWIKAIQTVSKSGK
ncbi:pleckstrin [Solea senegalensis]|uniref:Pleckstrin n=1 Tax=Solea senegalensis TaxID=28829 RepID=A0AAV6S644_SOLSE|nr:pleckstrin [Solea senegalensis]XP_058506863.1 pleckstrin [Solea solea]KAG7512834.1 pleckstrin [Solea senegalensis]